VLSKGLLGADTMHLKPSISAAAGVAGAAAAGAGAAAQLLLQCAEFCSTHSGLAKRTLNSMQLI
jgi:hypothetical protein